MGVENSGNLRKGILRSRIVALSAECQASARVPGQLVHFGDHGGQVATEIPQLVVQLDGESGTVDIEL